MSAQHVHGFTLIELVIALTVSVIVTSFAAMFVAGPVRGYTDQARRAELVDSASSALHRMARDVQKALPNSIRIVPVGSGFALEMFSTVDGGRYRNTPPPADTDKVLDHSGADTRFNVIGRFAAVAKPFTSTTHFLSVYNAGVPGANAWELASVITPPGTQIDIVADTAAGEDNVTMTPAFRFLYPSPRQRIYLVDGPVTWRCDPVAGSLHRYDGYAPASDQTLRDTAPELIGAGASEVRIAEDISACQLSYSPGTAQRAALLSTRLELSRDGERVSLLRQLHIENAP